LSSTIKIFLADMSPPHLNFGRDKKEQLAARLRAIPAYP
jgi:hypothetical protein